MLKWENKNDAYGNYFSADTGIGGEYVIQLYTDEVIGLLDEHAELFYIAASTVDEVKVACEADYARRVAALAAANGYVKADDCEAVKKQIDKEVIDSIADAHGRVEQLRDEDFDAMARLKGYIKLEPGQAVVPASALASAIRELRWLASSANLVSPGLWKEENSWTVSEFNNAIRAALEGK